MEILAYKHDSNHLLLSFHRDKLWLWFVVVVSWQIRAKTCYKAYARVHADSGTNFLIMENLHVFYLDLVPTRTKK